MSTTEIIAELTHQAKALGRKTPTDAELADAIGDVRAIEVRLADVRHRWETLTAEMDQIIDHDPARRINDNERAGAPVAVGQRWEVVPIYKTDRTFNPDAILVAVADELGRLRSALRPGSGAAIPDPGGCRQDRMEDHRSKTSVRETGYPTTDTT